MGQFPAQGGAPGQGGGAGGVGHKIENEGVSVIQRSALNFVGGGVTATDAGGKTVVTVPGFTASTTVIGRQQIFFPASCIYPELNKPTLQLQTKAIGTFGQVIQYIEFPRGDGTSASDTFAYFDWFTPSNIDLTPALVEVIAFWTTDTGTTEIINLQVNVIAKRDAEAIGSEAFVSPAQWSDAQAGVNTLNHDKAGGGPTIVSNPIPLDWFQFRLRRDVANDSNPGNIQLIGIKVEYVIENGLSS